MWTVDPERLPSRTSSPKLRRTLIIAAVIGGAILQALVVAPPAGRQPVARPALLQTRAPGSSHLVMPGR